MSPLLAPSLLLAASLVVAGCKPRLSLDGFKDSSTLRVAPGVIVHQTSGTTYLLCDRDGFGLLEGNVVMLHYQKNDGLLLVGYVLFGYDISDFKNIPPADIHYAVGHVDASGNLSGNGMTPLSQAEAATRYPRALSAAKPIDQLAN